MNSENLKTFLAIVETRNFSRAAQQMIVTQSTVSKRIAELEAETGHQLFIRDRTGVRLTREGSAFLEYAQQILNLQDKAMEQMSRTSQYTGYLVVGTAYAYYQLYLCDLLKSFLPEHPEISIRLRSGHTGMLINELRRAKMDVVFTHHPFQHPELVCKCLGADEVALVTDACNVEYAEGVHYSEVKNLPMIHSNFLYANTFNWLYPRNQQFQLEVDVAADALPLLKGSGWYTFLAKKIVLPLLEQSALREIPILGGEIPPLQHYMIYRKDAVSQPAMKALLKALEQDH